jgi:hypothetical protein
VGTFQWSIPFWRGWSVRIHSRMEEGKCFFTPTCGPEDVVLMSLLLIFRWAGAGSVAEERGRDGGELVVELEDAAVA